MPSFSQILAQSITDSGVKATSVYALVASLPLTGNTAGDIAYVQETSRLYIWSGSGWYNVALVNTSPTIISGPDAAYEFATDGTPIVLTLTAQDPEEVPISWSYQISSGVLGSTATIVQDGNTFTITPSTNTSDAGEFSITFSASDGINLATAASSFTLTFGTADAYYNLNSTLIKTGSTAGLTNATIIDESTNAFSVTRNGDVYQGSFSPYSPAGWSGYFDGAGDYLFAPSSVSSALNLSTGTCIEGWSYIESVSNYGFIFDSYQGTGNFVGWWYVGHTNTGNWRLSPGNGTSVDTGVPMALNVWNHWALTHDGTRARLFVNGVLIYTALTSAANADLFFTLSSYGGGNNGQYPIKGYISDFRVIVGASNIPVNYQTSSTTTGTQIFTPPTEKLTAISGTSLLILQDSWFKDNSSNNFAITRAGDVKPVPNSPYLPSEQYNPAVHGGSMYFDGSGDSLSSTGDSEFSFGTGDYTIEGWVYAHTISDARCVFYTRPASGYTHILRYSGTTGWQLYYPGGSNTSYTFNSNNNALNQWVHHAIVRNSGVLKWYINGAEVYSVSNSTNVVDTYLEIGNYASYYWHGYISDVRVVKGTAVYTSNFTPPTQSLTAISGTSLLVRGVNAGVYDETGKNTLSLIGNATTSTTVTKYNTTSMYFDGVGDYVRILDNPLFNFGSNDFTVECWFYGLGSNSTNGSTLVGKSNASSFGPINLSFHPTTKYLQANFSADGASWTFNITTNLTYDSLKNAWHHVVLARSGSSFNLYLDGTNVGTATNSSALVNNTEAFMVGYLNYTNTFWNGYIEDVRITNGYARYTSTFTPPTAALTEVSGTALLVNGSASGITDATGKTITVIGDATSSTSQTKYPDYSMYFDGSGDALTTFIPAGLGSGDFTVEMWVNHSVASNDDGLFHISSSATYNPNGTGFGLFHNTQYYIQHDGSYTNTGVVTSVSPLNTWRHIALVRESSTILMFVDGVLVKTLASTVDMTTWQYLQIGEYFQRNTTYSFNGYISDFRIVVGTALYSRNFTPPTAALGFSNAE